jgi:hypothetical protein
MRLLGKVISSPFLTRSRSMSLDSSVQDHLAPLPKITVLIVWKTIKMSMTRERFFM